MSSQMNYPQIMINKMSMPAMPIQQQIQQQRVPPYQPPSTPEEMAREKERITLLLEINSELLKHATNLQAQGLAGLIGSQQQPMEPAADNKAASEEYRECMRLLSYNISYLHAAANMVRNRPNTLAGPASMDPPESIPSLAEPYQRLKNLFPGWKGVAYYSAQRHPSGSMPQGQGGMAPNQVGMMGNQQGQMGQQFGQQQFMQGQYPQYGGNMQMGMPQNG